MPFEVQPLPKFEYFNRFPLEIRRQIWRLAMDPQIIEFFVPHIVEDVTDRQLPPWALVSSPHLSIPPILHVCHESREEALSYYEFGFAVSQHGKCVNGERCPSLTKIELTNCHRYWNPQSDLIFLRLHHTIVYRGPGRPRIREDGVSTCGHTIAKLGNIFDSRLRYLAIDDSQWGPIGGPWWVYMISSLEKIFVVVNRKFWQTPERSTDVMWLLEDRRDEKSNARWEHMKLERRILLEERMKRDVSGMFTRYAHADASNRPNLTIVESVEEIRRHIIQGL